MTSFELLDAAARTPRSILFIWSMAFITRRDFSASASPSIAPRLAGTTCHETPYLSVTQPHPCVEPPADR
jgi:hypothetical protein